MKSDIQGKSQCPRGQERFEEFTSNGRKLVQYDYRSVDGELFSCVRPTLDECRIARAKHLQGRELSCPRCGQLANDCTCKQ